MTVLAVVYALTAALLYAVGAVLQQRAASATPVEHSLRLGLLTRLAVNPLWVVGIVTDTLGYVFQFMALGQGSLVVVQPLLVSGLLFALPLGAAVTGTRLTRRDWGGALFVCVGLSVFLAVAAPATGHSDTSSGMWVGILVVAAILAALAAVAARGAPPRRRASLLAASAGLVYGVTAGLTKASSHLLRGGVPHLLASWQPYGLVVAGVVGMLLAQSAFQAGSLDASLPTLTVMDPIVSIAVGAVAFGESVAVGLAATTLELVGLALIIAGVFALGRSAAVLATHEGASAPGTGTSGTSTSGTRCGPTSAGNRTLDLRAARTTTAERPAQDPRAAATGIGCPTSARTSSPPGGTRHAAASPRSGP
jgi:drug/metabolite transporter (DMT)-like permease